jgi:hypothetical protein
MCDGVQVAGVPTRCIAQCLHGSKIDHSSIVAQKLATVPGDLRSDTTRVLDAPLAEVVQNAAETLVPLLLLLGRLAGIGCTELHKQCLTYTCTSQSAHDGGVA